MKSTITSRLTTKSLTQDSTCQKWRCNRNNNTYNSSNIFGFCTNKNSTWILVTCIWLLIPAISLGDECDLSSGADHQEIFLDDKEWLADYKFVITIFSIVFTSLISLLGSSICLFSIMEDFLSRKYLDDGDVVEGTVISTRFIRRHENSGAEYRAIVSYRLIECGGYVTLVQKEMTVRESDFLRSNALNYTSPLSINYHNREVHSNLYQLKDELDLYFDQSKSNFFENDTMMIDVLVLRSDPVSGIPKCWIERTCSFRNRCMTATFVMSLFWASFLSVICCVITLSPDWQFLKWYNWILIGIVTVIIWSLSACTVFTTARPYIEKELHDEFFSRGLMMVKVDDETLATESSESRIYSL